MRISDWSSDVCSSDLSAAAGLHVRRIDGSQIRYNNENPYLPDLLICRPELADAALRLAAAYRADAGDRKSEGSGKRVSVRVDLGGRRLNKKHKRGNSK